MSRLLSALALGPPLVMDGGMGTELYQAGLNENECGEAWNLTRPDRVRVIHRAYVAAGARCLVTNTFQANPCALIRHDREEDLERIVIAAVRVARSAIGSDGLVLGSIGPILISPDDHDFSDWDDLGRVGNAFLEPAVLQARLDGLLLETCSSPRALVAVEFLRHRVLDHDELPILLSLTYRRGPDGALVTHSGHSPDTFARHAERHGVAALGVNCGCEMSLDDIIEVIQRYRSHCDLPLFARPNAGTPQLRQGQATYPTPMNGIAERLEELVAAGVCMVGGCCGTTPGHISAINEIFSQQHRHSGQGELLPPVGPNLK